MERLYPKPVQHFTKSSARVLRRVALARKYSMRGSTGSFVWHPPSPPPLIFTHVVACNSDRFLYTSWRRATKSWAASRRNSSSTLHASWKTVRSAPPPRFPLCLGGVASSHIIVRCPPLYLGIVTTTPGSCFFAWCIFSGKRPPQYRRAVRGGESMHSCRRS